MRVPSFGEIIDHLTRKEWTEADMRSILGADARAGYLTYAANNALRAEAASGGTTSALLIHGIETGAFDGAIVCRTVIEEGRVRAEFVLARTAEDILAARGSKYVETKFLRDVLPILRENEGRFAVCGLPCDISNLRRWEEKELALKDKVALRVAFLCGHNSRTGLVDGVMDKLAKETGREDLTGFQFRTGHWRGQMTAHYSDGATVSKSFTYFSDYRNLSCFSERKCMACFDHFGYDSDLSIGDIWLFRLKDDPVKHSGVLTRTDRAEALLASAIGGGAVHSEHVPLRMILDGQSRIAPTHYDVTARRKAAKMLGIKINDPLQLKTSWVKVVSAYLGLWNMKFTEGRLANFVFRLPRPAVKAYLFFKKGLETIR